MPKTDITSSVAEQAVTQDVEFTFPSSEGPDKVDGIATITGTGKVLSALGYCKQQAAPEPEQQLSTGGYGKVSLLKDLGVMTLQNYCASADGTEFTQESFKECVRANNVNAPGAREYIFRALLTMPLVRLLECHLDSAPAKIVLDLCSRIVDQQMVRTESNIHSLYDIKQFGPDISQMIMQFVGKEEDVQEQCAPQPYGRFS